MSINFERSLRGVGIRPDVFRWLLRPLADDPTPRRNDEQELGDLRAESTVLAAVVVALEDSDRPEESPVEAVRRLRAVIARLNAGRVALANVFDKPEPTADFIAYMRDCFDRYLEEAPPPNCLRAPTDEVTEEMIEQATGAELDAIGEQLKHKRWALQRDAGYRRDLRSVFAVLDSTPAQALPPLVPDRPGQWLRYDTDAGEELECVVWEHSSFGLLWNWPGNGAGGPWGVGLMPELWRGPAPTDPAQAYRSLSDEAKALMWEIAHGDLTRDGAYKATGSEAEREALAAKCVVSDGVHVWVAQGCAHLVPGPHVQGYAEAAATLRAYFDSDTPGFEAIDVLLEGCAQANDRPAPAKHVRKIDDVIREMLKAPALAMLTRSVAGSSGTHPQGFWAEGHIVEVVGALKDDPRMTLVRSHGYTDVVATYLLKPLEPGTGSTWDDATLVPPDFKHTATAARIRDAFTSPKPATLPSQRQDALASRQRDRLDRIRDASTDELAALSRVYAVQVRERCAQAVQDMAQRYALMCAELDSSPEPDDGIARRAAHASKHLAARSGYTTSPGWVARDAPDAEQDDRIYLRALAAIYRTLAPGCPADEDGSGEWSIDDVVEAAKACAGDWLAVCKLLGFKQSMFKPAVTREIGKLQRAHVEICTTLGLRSDVAPSAITDRVVYLKRTIAEANETLAAYCPDCDPARSSLSSTVSLLVADVLDPAQVERERKREQLTQADILANARVAYVEANWRGHVPLKSGGDRSEQLAREIVRRLFDRALDAKAKA